MWTWILDAISAPNGLTSYISTAVTVQRVISWMCSSYDAQVDGNIANNSIKINNQLMSHNHRNYIDFIANCKCKKGLADPWYFAFLWWIWKSYFTLTHVQIKSDGIEIFN